jgi:hypothetical protein
VRSSRKQMGFFVCKGAESRVPEPIFTPLCFLPLTQTRQLIHSFELNLCTPHNSVEVEQSPTTDEPRIAVSRAVSETKI